MTIIITGIYFLSRFFTLSPKPPILQPSVWNSLLTHGRHPTWTDYLKHISVFVFKIPGLIIDAFGELRDQQEQVKEDMEVCSSNHSLQLSFCILQQLQVLNRFCYYYLGPIPGKINKVCFPRLSSSRCLSTSSGHFLCSALFHSPPWLSPLLSSPQAPCLGRSKHPQLPRS